MKAVWLFLFAAPAALWAQGAVEAPVLKQFQEHVADYLKLRETAAAKAAPLKATASPEAIRNHELQLAVALREARQNARPGDIFTPEVAAEFRRLIRGGLQGQAASRVRASIEHAEPVQIELHINERYPSHVPLPSTPPTLLQNLPPVPKELDYRVLGHELVLRDTGANLIIDYLTNAVP